MLTFKTGPLDESRFPDLAEFLKTWNEMRGERFAPAWEDFDFFVFPEKLVPKMYVIDVLDNPRDFRYRFIGTKLIEIEGKDYTGRSVDDLAVQKGEKLIRRQLDKYLDNPVPVFFAGSELVRDNNESVLYCGLRLPISDDGKSVSKIVCLASFVKKTPEFTAYLDTLEDS